MSILRKVEAERRRQRQMEVKGAQRMLTALKYCAYAFVALYVFAMVVGILAGH